MKKPAVKAAGFLFFGAVAVTTSFARIASIFSSQHEAKDARAIAGSRSLRRSNRAVKRILAALPTVSVGVADATAGGHFTLKLRV
ncbi:hypothetical protein [Cupriavidus numazuensis]|uniref:hypothetical protein n=1 Tax=Cupriavidus numazuensis TaxID=221992 RepID=UPI001BA4D416|nr:hypothetical protein [Cupriavidus numazuensis]